MQRQTEEQTCLMPSCKRKDIKARGICVSCYQATSRLVRNGKANWEDLERRGLVLQKAGGPSRSVAHEAIMGRGEGENK